MLSRACFSICTPVVLLATYLLVALVQHSFCSSTPRTASLSVAKTSADNEQYITIIEDQSTQPYGYLAMTSEHNYVIQSPCLHEQNWNSVTVNGHLVHLITKHNKTFSTIMMKLDHEQRDFLSKALNKFKQNLTGLKFAQHTSSVTPSLNDRLSPPPPLTSTRIQLGEDFLIANKLPPSAATFFQQQARGLRPRVSKKYKQLERSLRARSLKLLNKSSQQTSAARNLLGDDTNYARARTNTCSSGQQVGFNYYNLNQLSNQLNNTTLAGDVYYFDMQCNILDLYSSSVSVRQQLGLSILYRSPAYFAYSSSNLPLSINRFFLSGESVFFVYNDGSVLVKQNWMLDSIELRLVVQARAQLKRITTSGWQHSEPSTNLLLASHDISSDTEQEQQQQQQQQQHTEIIISKRRSI